MNVGENIRRIRKEKGLTQKELGELCGMYESQIRKYELGKANPKKETLDKIAKALKVDILSLFGIDLVMKERKVAIQEEAKKRKIDKIISYLENNGYGVTFSSLQQSDFPNNGICEIYINDDETIIVKDSELIEIENSVNDFLKFKLNEIIKKKKIHKIGSGIEVGKLHLLDKD